MAMDFFEHQERARKRTALLVILFVIAVILTIAAVYFVVAGTVAFAMERKSAGAIAKPFVWFDWTLLGIVAGATLVVICGGSLFKVAQLRGGGAHVAELLGGQSLHGNTKDPDERKALNVVEEMALASGMPVPSVYLLRDEDGINAFAAGHSPDDAVVGVTRGCIRRLTRDELQGVIAHEFSHILNGDMRMNLRLIGLLHGILLIGLIGYGVLRGMSYRSYGRSRDGRGAVVVLVLGVGLMVVGYVGTFFGKLIKASVSRQREFLADASAVQFTRNPVGIADALKRIGGFAPGSRIVSPNAPQASHMFFGEAQPSMLQRLTSTHPPLADRIRRIQPSWDGEMIQEVATPAELMNLVVGLVDTSGPARVPKKLVERSVESIGRPTKAHLAYARTLVEGLPPAVVEAARESFSARAVVYALLLSDEAPVRDIQLRFLAEAGDRGMRDETGRLRDAIAKVDLRARLPLIDSLLPSLRELTGEQFDRFKATVNGLIRADQKLDLFEWLLQRSVIRHLEPNFSSARKERVKYYALHRLGRPCSQAISTLAHLGGRDADTVRRGFDRAAQVLDEVRISLVPRESIKLSALDESLRELARTAPRLRRRVIQACTACVIADEKITIREAELLRGICDSLECPMPPILPGELDADSSLEC